MSNKPIVVGYDGSPGACLALDFAIEAPLPALPSSIPKTD